MVTIETCFSACQLPGSEPERRRFRNGLSTILLFIAALPAHAIPPPPGQPPQLREATMVVAVQLVEASNGRISRITRLCDVSGKIPVYADDGSAASHHAREIPGCTMPDSLRKLPVHVRGAKALSKDRISYATASVEVVPPDAAPACPELCGPQRLADSHGAIRVSGNPRSMKFSLMANPGSILNAKPTIWLEADVEIVD